MHTKLQNRKSRLGIGFSDEEFKIYRKILSRTLAKKRDAASCVPVTQLLNPALALLRLFHLQIVLNGENSCNAIRANESIVLVCLGSYHPYQVHMTVLHDNVD